MATITSDLFFESYNEDKQETIVLLHGLLSSHKEYDLVIPHLTAYHVLALDLNGHSRSAAIKPTTTYSSADKVAQLIRTHAKGGSAHVVGLSFGGFVRLVLAGKYLALVRSLFVSGSSPFEGLFKWMAERPLMIWYSFRAVMILPEWMYWKMAGWKGMGRHEGLYADIHLNLTWEDVRDAYTSILDLSFEDVGKLEVRILGVAGGKEDDLGSMRKMGRVIRTGKAVVIKEAFHAWDLQFPELFATGILAWVRDEELPVEFDEFGTG